MTLQDLILRRIQERGETRAAEIVQLSGFSRSYVNRKLQELRDEGQIILIGRANQAHYIIANKGALLRAKKQLVAIRKVLKNQNLSEDTVLDEIKRQSGIFLSLRPNVARILDYAFTELLNNAIEHSQSQLVEIKAKRTKSVVTFEIKDRGIGIFNNIMRKRKLKNELEAIQDLLKGKQTTMPEGHSGEGVFFTSRMADTLVIESSTKKLLFNNIIEDMFLQDIRPLKGTRVVFTIAVSSKKETEAVFKEYTGDSLEFDKTKVAVRLYKMGSLHVSRSQARRIMTGLTDFKTITLDFKHIPTIGQAFADEIFRVWKNHHPSIKVIPMNTGENVNFMIARAQTEEGAPSQPELFAA